MSQADRPLSLVTAPIDRPVAKINVAPHQFVIAGRTGRDQDAIEHRPRTEASDANLFKLPNLSSPAEIKRTIIAGTLDKTNEVDNYTRLLIFKPSVYTSESFVHE